MYKKYFKRPLDVLAALAALAVTGPFIILVAIGLWCAYKGNPFFIQKRPGKYEKEIDVIKFRTMDESRDNGGQLLPNKARVTGAGRLIRALSIDELPQLINVLLGDMSMVGPRPLLFKYLPLYTSRQRRRHEVTPGITGWAQVNGRNAISWKEKFDHDVWYVDNISFWLDLKIIWLTIVRVLQRSGIDKSATETMPPFDGTN